MKAKVYSAFINGTCTQIKAYKKVNAIARFKMLDKNVSNIKVINAQNSHQATVEDCYPEICK